MRDGIGGDSHPSFHAKKCGPGLSDPHCQHLMTRQKSPNSASFARNSKLDPERSGGRPSQEANSAQDNRIDADIETVRRFVKGDYASQPDRQALKA